MMAQRITRLVFMAGGVVLPTLAEAATALLAPDHTLRPEQLLDLQAAACALADGRNRSEEFCARAAGICAREAAAGLLDERLAERLVAQPGMPDLIAKLAEALEVRLVSDYPPGWLLPALARSELARCFPAAEIAYTMDLGGLAGLFDALVADRVLLPGQAIWVDAHSARTSAALRRGIDAAIFVDARRLRRDLGLWRLLPFPA